MRRQPIFRLLDMPGNVDQARTQLWRAVLDQAVWDASSTLADPAEVRARDEALAWLSTRNVDFLQVCEYASVEPEMVDKVIRFLNESTSTTT